MRAQLRSASQGGSVNEAKLKEKDDYIKALQVEGSKLSAKNTELETAARTARAQLRDVEAECDRLASQLVKTERRAETAEREAVELREEWLEAKEEADLELEQVKEEAAKKLAAAKKEAGKLIQQSQKENKASEALAAALEREAALTQALNETRMAMEEAAAVASDREYQLRDEAASLERRVRELEAVNHSLQLGGGGGVGSDGGGAAGGSSLLRQLESMTAAADMQQQAAEETENRLAAQVADLRRQVAAAVGAEKEAMSTIDILREEIAAAKQGHESSKIALLEAQECLKIQQQRCSELEIELAQAQAKLSQVATSLERHTATAAAEREKLQESLWEAEEALRTEASERKELEKQLVEKVAEAAAAMAAAAAPAAPPPPGKLQETSPEAATPVENKGKDDIIEDEMDVMLRSMSIGSTSASVAESSTSISGVGMNLNPQRVHMLQQQLRLAESARDASNEQLVIALENAEKSRLTAQRAVTLEEQLGVVTKKLDVALEVLGEKKERVEALEEDIRDMKAIFHEQISLAADQLADARAQLAKN
jgi:hypothetical protein